MHGRAKVHPQFSMRMRELLIESGMSYRALATKTFYSKSYLQELAAGKKPPPYETALHIDHALDAEGSLAELVTDPRGCLPSLLGHGWGQRDNEVLAGELLSVKPSTDNAIRLAHEWLIAESPQVFELRSGRRIGAEMVETIAGRVQQLRLLDDHVGGGKTYPLVSVELSTTANLLREAAYPERLGRRLLVTIADLCQLAGFIAADTGRYPAAKHLHLLGVRAAHAGGDAEAAANNLSSVAYIEANVGDPQRAVMLAGSACTGVRTSGSATVRALMLERLAWANARAGDEQAAARALGTVEETYVAPRPEDDPLWTYWLSADEVEVMAGRVWTELRRPSRAVPILERTTALYGSDVPREAALYLTWLAEALIHAGDIAAAADRASVALRLARDSYSRRTQERVTAVRAMLAMHPNVKEVGALEQEFRDTATVSANILGHIGA